MRGRTGWALLIAANVVFLCVLSFYRKTDAAPRAATPAPFANAVAQRMEMINELKEIRAEHAGQSTECPVDGANRPVAIRKTRGGRKPGEAALRSGRKTTCRLQ
jgi:hypothetical protein